MYTMGTLLRHGSEDQKRRYLPQIARGELRLQAFAVTEPNSGSEATRIQTRAVRKGDRYIVNGQKIFISRVKQSDLMLLLARTTPYDDVKDKTQGISVFIVDMRNVRGKLDVQPLDMMVNHHTNSVFFEDVEVPAENLIGEEGRGFSYIIDGWNAERILVASEAIGDGRWFVNRAVNLCPRSRSVWKADRGESRNSVSHRAGVCSHRSRRPDAFSSRRQIRPPRKMRSRGEHGEAAGIRGRMGSGEYLPDHPRRVRFCARIRCGAKVPRDAIAYDRAGQ